MKKRLFILLVTIFTVPSFVIAQCNIIQPESSMTLTVDAIEEIGQSFTACNGGAIETIEVMISNLSMATINLELKIATGGNTTTGVFHTQMVTTSTSGMLKIPISKEIPLTKDQVYTFSLIGTSGSGSIDYAMGIGDTYAGGNALRNNVVFNTSDLEFGVFIGAEPAAAAVAPIPTMNQWGLFIFGLLLVNIGVMFIQHLQRLVVLD